jgi:hypothetical protein
VWFSVSRRKIDLAADPGTVKTRPPDPHVFSLYQTPGKTYPASMSQTLDGLTAPDDLRWPSIEAVRPRISPSLTKL